jgi:hypothetical protein
LSRAFTTPFLALACAVVDGATGVGANQKEKAKPQSGSGQKGGYQLG